MKDADSGCRILALAPNNWDGLWMNRQQLLSRLSETYPVLYSTGARSTWDRGFLSRGPGGLLGCFARHGGVTVDHPAALLLRIHAIPRLDEIAVQIAVRRWRRELARHGSRPLIAYAFHPQFQRYINALRPDFLIYHVYDLYWRGQGWSAENEAQQLRLLNEAGLVIASSTVIAHELSAKAGRRVHVVPNAVDYATFSRPASGPEPPDLALIPHPRIGHVGRLNRKVDIELVIALARRHPRWSFVLVGPVVDLSAPDQAAYEQCSKIPNIHMLGVKAREDLPSYMQRLDVGVMAYKQGALWTEGIYPLKLHEYLACGLPVVSSDIPAMHEFPALVRTASTEDQWSAAIAAACTENGPEHRELRRATAQANSWDQRVRMLQGLIEAMTGRTVAQSNAQCGDAL